VLVHGNGTCALGALGGTTASIWRGQGGVYGRDRGLLLRGIDHGGRHGASGEVMGRGTVDGALPRSCALGSHGNVQGRRGVRWVCLCIAGPG
jgi:hypothetical protein